MICALLGLAGVVVLRAVFGKTGIDAGLPIPVVVYLCTWVAVTLAIWLLWLGLRRHHACPKRQLWVESSHLLRLPAQ